MFRQPSSNIPTDFDAVRLSLASPERIKSWSQGEVTKPETINYRTQRSERNGLFDEKIFGPEKDYECYCGKYRGIRFKGIVCEKCGVELTRASVRRERMGHIDLASPVAHIWFLRSLPSRLSLFLGMSSLDVERVIYFAGYLVTTVDEKARAILLKDLANEYKNKSKTITDEKTVAALKEKMLATKRELHSIVPGLVLDENTFHTYAMRYGACFEAEIGAEALYNLCKRVDMAALQKELEEAVQTASVGERERLSKRLALVRGMIGAELRPEWFFLTRIPVIPPGLRPMVPLDGGRFATSDVNDLYRRVINRNNRLKKLKEINAPEVILWNEKRILQEAVDSLIDNAIRHTGGGGPAARRELKSLSDNLQGKRGLLRQNLLGKRVDYSGRSVIVVGPELRLHQCGLPKEMALELFRPLVISGLIKRELAFNIRGAGRLIEDQVPEVWAILEEVIKDKFVLLNRAPTLHRLSVQAFQPILIEGSAIQVHPLVCYAFNADFDGDQMAVHVPLSDEAQLEAREFMASDKNILKPGNGEPTVSAKMLDIVLGVYWTTKLVPGERGKGMYFGGPGEAITAFQHGYVGIRAPIKVRADVDKAKYAHHGDGFFETSVGRILFNEILPSDYPFVNEVVDKKRMGILVDDLVRCFGVERVPAILDAVKDFGFAYATVSGTTWGIDEVVEPLVKEEIIARAKSASDEVYAQWGEGLLSEEERMRKNIEIWHGAKNEVEKLIPSSLAKDGSVEDLVRSGARGTMAQITQMVGMKGLIQGMSGETIEIPIVTAMKEGLSPIEYFITTHGSRKGQTDTALNTAKAGYLTRKLFVAAQDVVITADDCGTKEFLNIKRSGASGMEISFAKSARGRILAADTKNPSTGETLFKKGHMLTKANALFLDSAGVQEVSVRSPLRCALRRGLCAHCYGEDLGRGELVALGEAVGTVAAQAIGEPGTQLTMRTFHAGGAASVGGDITQGLPRVEEVFENRHPKSPAVIAGENGVITDITDTGKEKVIVLTPEPGAATREPIAYTVGASRMPLVKAGDTVAKGALLTDGSADIEELFRLGGKERAQEYIIAEISKPYELQGESVSRKHIEVIIRQMFSRLAVTNAGDTGFSPGDVVDQEELDMENEEAQKRGEREAEAEAVVLGISKVSLSRRSFLSAASFQQTTRVLISAAVRGSADNLKGLMENVLIGRLIPAGTGFKESPRALRIAAMQDERARARAAEAAAMTAATEITPPQSI